MTYELRDRLQPTGRLDILGGVFDLVNDYHERLGVEQEQTETLRQRTVNYSQKADVLVARGDFEAAQEAYIAVSELMARLADAEPNNTDRQRDLSVILNQVGDIKSAQGDLAGALSAYQQNLAIAERLAVADPSNAGWQLDLVVSLWKLTDEGLAEPEAAWGYLTRALEILQQLEAEDKLHGRHR